MNPAPQQSGTTPEVETMSDYIVLLLLDQPDRMFTHIEDITPGVFEVGKIPDTPQAKKCYQAALKSLTTRGIIIKTTDPKTRRTRRIKLNINAVSGPQQKDLRSRSDAIARCILDTLHGSVEHVVFQQLLADCEQALKAMQKAAQNAPSKYRKGDLVVIRAQKTIMDTGLSYERVRATMYYLKRLELTEAVMRHSSYRSWWRISSGTVSANKLKDCIRKDGKIYSLVSKKADDTETSSPSPAIVVIQPAEKKSISSGWTQPQANIRDRILSGLTAIPGHKITSPPNVVSQLRRVCDFPRGTKTSDIEVVLEKMSMISLIACKRSKAVIFEVRLATQ
jgi:hypothetical protein